MTEKTKKAPKKKAPKKKAPAKQAEALPVETKKPEEVTLPRGQMRLPDGSIRLKSGAHDLGKDGGEFDIAGAKITLKGKVLVSSPNVNWLAIHRCQKCKTPRPGPVTMRRTADGHVLFMFTCSNKKECDLGGLLYVQVHTPGKIVVED